MNLFSILHIPSIVVLVHVNVHVLKSPLERMSVDFEIPYNCVVTTAFVVWFQVRLVREQSILQLL